MNSSVADFVRREVPDWDDEVVATARFKAFSGQRSDWEPKLLFWRDLILKVARHLGVFVIQAHEVKNKWFARGGLTPLCIDHVLVEMYNGGDILRGEDLMDPTAGRLHLMFKRVASLIRLPKTAIPQDLYEDHLILRTLLQERADEVIKALSESHWTSSCVITMEKFRSICRGSNEASAVLSYFYGCGKAQYFSISKTDSIEGVKISLVLGPVLAISTLDRDSLHLIWTTEKLQQQLDVINQRCEKSRKSALEFIKFGNKPAALRHVRQLKLTSESREKCTALLTRVEEVLGVIADAESTKKVSEAIRVGARAIKENRISVEEVHFLLEELDESVASQKQTEEALDTVIEDEDMEEEFKKLEMEFGNQSPQVQITETVTSVAAKEEPIATNSAELLSETLSNLKLEAA